MNSVNVSEIAEITPAIARELISRNTRNRPLSQRTVRELEMAIKHGEWQLNGEAIKIDRDGNLIDGQHRLTAVIRSGQSIRTYVIRDLESDSFKTIDTGKRRSNADALHLIGHKNAHLLAATVRVVASLARNQLRSNEQISNIQMEQFIESHPRISESVEFVKGIRIDQHLPSALAAGLHYAFAGIDRDDADCFFLDLAKGSMLSEKDPVFQLREKLLFYKGRSGARLSRREIAAHLIKAWNYRRSGKIVKRLIWAKKSGEPFPVAI